MKLLPHMLDLTQGEMIRPKFECARARAILFT